MKTDKRAVFQPQRRDYWQIFRAFNGKWLGVAYVGSEDKANEIIEKLRLGEPDRIFRLVVPKWRTR